MAVSRDPYRVGTTQCDESSLGPYTYNKKFEIQKGHDYWIEDEVRFPHEALLRAWDGKKRADGTYRTRFGPCVEHTGTIYGDSNHNVRLGLRRLLAIRKDDPVKDLQLQAKQLLFFEKHKKYFDNRAADYAIHFGEYTNEVFEALLHHADPHDKKDLRIQAWLELLETGRVAEKLWLKQATLKMKKNEWAKHGKNPRMIADLKVPASLQGFILTDMYKKAQSKSPAVESAGTRHFCKSPNEAELQYVFDEMESPSGASFFAFFSDDSCISIRRPDGTVFRANLDISKCDASHGPAVFRRFINNCPEGSARDTARNLVAQCKQPLRVYDKANSKNYVQLKPISTILLSGSTITTAINNVASDALGYSITLKIRETGKCDKETIQSAAADVGYYLTVDECEILEDVQFLKHSPVLDTAGAWRPLLNPGVILRFSGVCQGDLPGNSKHSLEERGKAFQASLITGAAKFASYPLVDNMKRSAAGANRKLKSLTDKVVAKSFQHKITTEVREVRTFYANDVYRRYRLQESEIASLDDVFGNASFGEFYCGSGAAKILELDYDGLSCRTVYDRNGS